MPSYSSLNLESAVESNYGQIPSMAALRPHSSTPASPYLTRLLTQSTSQLRILGLINIGEIMAFLPHVPNL